MSYFNISLAKLGDAINEYNKHRLELKDSIDLLYNCLEYTDSAWNDDNSIKFIGGTKRDRYKITEYLNNYDKYYGEISLFKNNIYDICSRYGHTNESMSINFDDSSLNDLCKVLDDMVLIADDCNSKIDVNRLSENFPDLSGIYRIKDSINETKNKIIRLRNNIVNFCNEINNEILASQTRVKRIDDINLNIEEMSFNWKLVDLNQQQMDELENKENLVSSSNSIDIKTESDSLKGINSQNIVTAKNSSIDNETNNNDINFSNILNVSAKDNTIKYEVDSSIKFNDISNVESRNNNINIDVKKDYDLSDVKELDANDPKLNFNLEDVNLRRNDDSITVNDSKINLNTENVELSKIESLETKGNISINSNSNMQSELKGVNKVDAMDIKMNM